MKNKKLSYFTKLYYHAPIGRMVVGLGGKKKKIQNTKSSFHIRLISRDFKRM